jgi:hypothetical protein
MKRPGLSEWRAGDFEKCRCCADPAHSFVGILTWGPDPIEPICDERGEMNSGQEVPGELVVSGGYTPEVLEPAKKQRSMTFRPL